VIELNVLSVAVALVVFISVDRMCVHPTQHRVLHGRVVNRRTFQHCIASRAVCRFHRLCTIESTSRAASELWSTVGRHGTVPCREGLADTSLHSYKCRAGRDAKPSSRCETLCGEGFESVETAVWQLFREFGRCRPVIYGIYNDLFPSHRTSQSVYLAATATATRLLYVDSSMAMYT